MPLDQTFGIFSTIEGGIDHVLYFFLYVDDKEKWHQRASADSRAIEMRLPLSGDGPCRCGSGNTLARSNSPRRPCEVMY